MIYCQKCGNQNVDGAIFCNRCGANLCEEQGSEHRKGSIRRFIILVVLVGVIIGFFVLAFRFLVEKRKGDAYSEALDCLKHDGFDRALEIFEELDDYEDSKELGYVCEILIYREDTRRDLEIEAREKNNANDAKDRLTDYRHGLSWEEVVLNEYGDYFSEEVTSNLKDVYAYKYDYKLCECIQESLIVATCDPDVLTSYDSGIPSPGIYALEEMLVEETSFSKELSRLLSSYKIEFESSGVACKGIECVAVGVTDNGGFVVMLPGADVDIICGP